MSESGLAGLAGPFFYCLLERRRASLEDLRPAHLATGLAGQDTKKGAGSTGPFFVCVTPGDQAAADVPAPSIIALTAARPRLRRLFTVPMFAPVTSAASS